MKIGRKLRQMRKERNLTLKNVADQCDISTSYLSNLEKGANIPSSEVLDNLSRFFQIPRDELEPELDHKEPTSGSPLRRLRLEAGLSMEEVANTIGISQTFLSLIERGKRNPSHETLQALAKYYGVSGDQIVGIDSSDPPIDLVELIRNSHELYVDDLRIDLRNKEAAEMLINSVRMAAAWANYPEQHHSKKQ